MAADATLVASLKEFYGEPQIREMWKEVLQALVSRVQAPVQITSSTFEGGSGTGMVVTGPQEMRDFIEACRQAIRELGGDTSVAPEALGTGVDFSGRCVGA